MVEQAGDKKIDTFPLTLTYSEIAIIPPKKPGIKSPK
jgi:hypothetical protein